VAHASCCDCPERVSNRECGALLAMNGRRLSVSCGQLGHRVQLLGIGSHRQPSDVDLA